MHIRQITIHLLTRSSFARNFNCDRVRQRQPFKVLFICSLCRSIRAKRSSPARQPSHILLALVPVSFRHPSRKKGRKIYRNRIQTRARSRGVMNLVNFCSQPSDLLVGTSRSLQMVKDAAPFVRDEKETVCRDKLGASAQRVRECCEWICGTLRLVFAPTAHEKSKSNRVALGVCVWRKMPSVARSYLESAPRSVFNGRRNLLGAERGFMRPKSFWSCDAPQST